MSPDMFKNFLTWKKTLKGEIHHTGFSTTVYKKLKLKYLRFMFPEMIFIPNVKYFIYNVDQDDYLFGRYVSVAGIGH